MATASQGIAAAFDALRQGQLPRAEQMARALVAAPDADARAHALLGRVLAARGDLVAARASVDRALALDADCVPARVESAALARHAGDLQRAIGDLEALVRLQPRFLPFQLDFGDALIAGGQPERALAAFTRAAALDARNLRAHDGVARAHWALKSDMRDWLAAREAMAAIEATAAAYTRLAFDYGKASNFAAMRAAFDRALALDPDWLPARWGRMQHPRELVHPDAAALDEFRRDWLAGLEWFERHEYVAARAPEYRACMLSATNFYLHYLGEAFVDEQRRYARVVERMVALAAPDSPAAASRASDGRLRVGFISAFFRRHAMTKLFGALVTGLDRARFEVSLFYPSAIEDDVTAALRAGVDHFESGERPIAAWSEALRARELDVLVFVDIGMHTMAQALAAMRHAPRQYQLWGHPVTSGFAAIDGFVSADGMEPPGAGRNYAEPLLRLPRLGCVFAPPSLAPVSVPELEDGAGRIEVFFAQAAFKVMPAFDDVLARIAQRAPAVRFHFTPHAQSPARRALRERLARAFATRGLAFDDHAGLFRHVGEAEFLGVARASHFSLDSMGWSGGVTTLEILWHDAPVLTLPGKLMRGRHTSAMLDILELPELVARDVDDYVERAVRLATDADWRDSLRARIRERKHRLYDDRGVIAAFTDLLGHAAAVPSRAP